MGKAINTGVATCDLCEKIAVEISNNSSRCINHAGDKKYHELQERINILKRLLGDVMTYARAKDGSEVHFSNISKEINTVLWKV